MRRWFAIYSFVFVWQTSEDYPGNEVASGVDSCKHIETPIEIGPFSNTLEGIAWALILKWRHKINWETTRILVRVVNWVRIIWRRRNLWVGKWTKRSELVAHEGLVGVFEDRQVLELFHVPGNLICWYEEACEEHERDNQDRGQCYSQLFVRETCWNDQGVATTSVVGKDQDQQEG